MCVPQAAGLDIVANLEVTERMQPAQQLEAVHVKKKKQFCPAGKKSRIGPSQKAQVRCRREQACLGQRECGRVVR